MKLYAMAGACSLASHISLTWAGASFELAMLTHQDLKGEAYLRVNPKGAVPALEVEPGKVITESLAVLEYIADRFPEAGLGAASNDIFERARLNETLAELVSDVHKAWAPIFAPARFVQHESEHDSARHAAFAQLDKHYARLNETIKGREWLLFERRTVADAYLYVMCRWKDRSPAPLASYPALFAFKTRLDADTDIKRAIEREQK